MLNGRSNRRQDIRIDFRPKRLTNIVNIDFQKRFAASGFRQSMLAHQKLKEGKRRRRRHLQAVSPISPKTNDPTCLVIIEAAEAISEAGNNAPLNGFSGEAKGLSDTARGRVAGPERQNLVNLETSI